MRSDRGSRAGGFPHARRLAAGALLALSTTFVLGACGSEKSTEPTGSASASAETTSAAPTPAADGLSAEQVKEALKDIPSLEGKKIAYISALPIEYLSTSYESARMAVEELGGTFQVYDSEGDPNKELANVRTAINQGTDGLLVFSTSPAAISNIAKIAHESDVPIVHYYAYVDAVADKTVVDAWVGADATEIGRDVGNLMAENLEAGDQVAAITGHVGTAEVSLYEAGFEKVMDDKGIEVVATPTSEWRRQAAFEEAQQLLSRYPNLKGLFCHNDDTMMGCVSALRQSGKQPGDVVLATLNVSPTGIQLIKEGWMVGGVQQSPPLESAIATRLLAQIIAGEQPPLEQGGRCWADTPVATAENVDQLDPVTTWTFNEETIREALVRECVGVDGIASKGNTP
jgi:ABC-type sugar transport system substrate-binding protein